MTRRAKALRRLPPTARKVAKLINELHSIERRLDNLVDALARHEFDAEALWVSREVPKPPASDQEAEELWPPPIIGTLAGDLAQGMSPGDQP